LLETVRQYAWERLREGGDEAVTRRRHRDWYLGLAERADAVVRGPDQRRWLDGLETEHANLREALEWTLATGDAVTALRLGAGLAYFWYVRGHLSEGRAWLERLLEAAPPVVAGPATAGLRAKALYRAGAMAVDQADFDRAAELGREGLRQAEALGDREHVALSLHILAQAAAGLGDYREAVVLHERALAIRRDLGDRRGVALSLLNLGIVSQWEGDHERAAEAARESLAVFEALEDPWGVGSARNLLGMAAYHRGDAVAAVAEHRASLALARELGNSRGVALSQHNLGLVALRRGDATAAQSLLAESLTGFAGLGDRWGAALALEHLAWVAHRWGDDGRAARLLGAADALRAAIKAAMAHDQRDAHERILAVLRAALGDDGFAAAWAAGQALRLDEAMALALEVPAPRSSVAPG
jgi:tetratricopeptide (TPR) repeat protein